MFSIPDRRSKPITSYVRRCDSLPDSNLASVSRYDLKFDRGVDFKTVTENRVFLKAEWRNLAMLNYEVAPAMLARFLPPETELDRWNGKVFVSLVGFCFLRTKIFGLPIPFHRNFDEVNLRFYVRRTERTDIRRGVVFIKEIVPRRAIAAIARSVYNERYVALPMNHHIRTVGPDTIAEYGWQSSIGWNRMSVQTKGSAALPQKNSEEQFITEHSWGYALQSDGTTMEYRVDHPAWRVWTGRDAKFEGDMSALYGPELAEVICRKPSSAFLAEGSAVTVFRGRRI